MREGGKSAIEAQSKGFKKRIHQLEGVFCKETLDIEIFKEAVRIHYEKPSFRGGSCPVRRIFSETGAGSTVLFCAAH
ncbi:hypothetical protein LI168_00160 [Desulfovibrio desulfuricans]|uniref:hypothetical protein n=1 Tax=Desulfovibrio desulfuricans TaxID=876 RepID=UPI001D07E179|nr:hypothetical protein [Desulfovibrio desulfuricans]MCB6540554.1 hypothetical protein [Desulfovibrio desulfuricans]MCB6551636.1 hypothetical protein [Desulfovibrio desulfuricans]MCB6563479.1 hypothetical protein [Desulfovibrio desulfuricans]MCB7344932.1 hypothetical protein [Desulfovibrio desulfuricans]MCQ4860086.1 hypothetical protein [Desulfovibrio desulfuricans]